MAICGKIRHHALGAQTAHAQSASELFLDSPQKKFRSPSLGWFECVIIFPKTIEFQMQLLHYFPDSDD